MREIRFALTHGFFGTRDVLSKLFASILILLGHLHTNAMPNFIRVRDGLTEHRDRMGWDIVSYNGMISNS